MALDPFSAGFELVTTALNKFFPDANEELRGKLTQAATEINNEFQLQLKQIEVNQEEAKHPSIFIAGWRPFVGWVGGFGLAYQLMLMPILNGVFLAFGATAPFIGIDISLLQGTLGTLLGLGMARSWDKKNGKDTKTTSHPNPNL